MLSLTPRWSSGFLPAVLAFANLSLLGCAQEEGSKASAISETKPPSPTIANPGLDAAVQELILFPLDSKANGTEMVARGIFGDTIRSALAGLGLLEKPTRYQILAQVLRYKACPGGTVGGEFSNENQGPVWIVADAGSIKNFLHSLDNLGKTLPQGQQVDVIAREPTVDVNYLKKAIQDKKIYPYSTRPLRTQTEVVGGNGASPSPVFLSAEEAAEFLTKIRKKGRSDFYDDIESTIGNEKTPVDQVLRPHLRVDGEFNERNRFYSSLIIPAQKPNADYQPLTAIELFRKAFDSEEYAGDPEGLRLYGEMDSQFKLVTRKYVEKKGVGLSACRQIVLNGSGPSLMRILYKAPADGLGDVKVLAERIMNGIKFVFLRKQSEKRTISKNAQDFGMATINENVPVSDVGLCQNDFELQVYDNAAGAYVSLVVIRRNNAPITQPGTSSKPPALQLRDKTRGDSAVTACRDVSRASRDLTVSSLMNQPSSSSPRCGSHTRISQNEHVRLSQCPCGAYHVAFVNKGVSVQLDFDEVQALAGTLGVALRVADAEERGRLLPSGTGSSIN